MPPEASATGKRTFTAIRLKGLTHKNPTKSNINFNRSIRDGYLRFFSYTGPPENGKHFMLML